MQNAKSKRTMSQVTLHLHFVFCILHLNFFAFDRALRFDETAGPRWRVGLVFASLLLTTKKGRPIGRPLKVRFNAAN